MNARLTLEIESLRNAITLLLLNKGTKSEEPPQCRTASGCCEQLCLEIKIVESRHPLATARGSAIPPSHAN